MGEILSIVPLLEKLEKNKKIKHTFARSLKQTDRLRGKGLPVTLNYFLNSDINPPMFTKVFLFSAMDESYKQSILNKILSEIHYHNQFEEMRRVYEMDEISYGECLFKMPPFLHLVQNPIILIYLLQNHNFLT